MGDVLAVDIKLCVDVHKHVGLPPKAYSSATAGVNVAKC